jgi:hypothetical protein
MRERVVTERPDVDPTALDAAWPGRRARALLLASPAYLAVPVLFAVWFRSLAGPLPWTAMGLGALGWWTAILLRLPLGPIASRLGPKRGQLLVVAASGPLEELVRLAACLVAGRALATALAIGLGWGAIEVAFALVNAFVLLAALRRNDQRAREVWRELMESGIPLDASPLYGALERVSATALHVGFTLLIAASPWLVLITIPVHSGVNLLALRYARRLIATELTLLAVAGVVLGVGLAWHAAG